MGFPDRAVGKESTCNAGVSNYWLLSHARLFVTPWTAAHQAPLSMKFSRQGYGSGLPFPSPGDLPNPGIEPGSPVLQADSLLTELQRKPNAGNKGSNAGDPSSIPGLG